MLLITLLLIKYNILYLLLCKNIIGILIKMLAAGQLFIRPVSWAVTNIDNKKFIECTGYTSNSSSIYVRLPCNITHVVNTVTSDNVRSIIDINRKYDVLDITNSSNNNVLILRVDGNSTTSANLQDTYGALSSLWATLNIGPYDSLILNNYTPLPGKYTICDLNVSTDEIHIEPLADELTVNLKLLFVDYRPVQQCFYVTLINGVQYHDYNISWAINAILKSQVISAQDEQQAWAKLFGIYTHLQPDLLIYFGRDTLTTLQQYLIEQKPRLSKVINANNTIIDNLPLIDLQQFITKFHSLIQHNTLQESLTNGNVKTLHDLCLRLNAIETLTIVCNNLGVTYNEILTSNDIIDRVVYNIDAGAITFIKPQPLRTMNHLKSRNTSTVSNYVYDYSKLYQELMMTSNNALVTVLAARLEFAPSSLITNVFYSRYVDHTLLLPELHNQLKQLEQAATIDAITATHIYSSQLLTSSWLQLVIL